MRPAAGDTTAVPGARVVLHRVGRSLQGPVDSAVSDRRGRFRFTFRADTASLYLLSARFGGIEYFSPPVPTNPERPDTAIEVAVYDTSSTAPVSVAARHVVVPRPDEDGSRPVLDLLVLRNAGWLARVAPDTIRPSWSGPLPPGTLGLEIGESDVSPDAVSRRGDSVYLSAPLAPGEKQLALQYLIPAGLETVTFPIGSEGGTVNMLVNMLVEERGASVSGAPVTLADSQLIEGRWFKRWNGKVTGGGSLRLTLPGTGRSPVPVLAALVGALALVLLTAGWLMVARRRRLVATAAAPAVRLPSPDRLVDAIATLDTRYGGRQQATDPEEWDRYLSERARLKAELEASLAPGTR